jgi:hypothetical protein
MSATIIAFPTKRPAALRAPGRNIDILPVDRRGLVILDACVPMSLAAELMALFDSYQDKPVARVRGGVPPYNRPVFSFDMTQPDAQRGNVLIDACVPEQLAKEFIALAEMSSAA